MSEPEEGTVKLESGSLHSQAACPERYEIKGLIGHGGMGMVFHAFDTSLGRDVAIKVLFCEGAREPDMQTRFLREAQTLAVLGHPNIVKMFNSGINFHGSPYHVMEFLQGNVLSQELSSGPLSASSFFALFAQILSGLEYAHKEQVVHRDLKPSNIMHCQDTDGKDLYKLIDFGIARVDMSPERAAKTLTRTDAILGSPLYISPEQCRGERGDYLSDIYSLGCIMYECISGKPPFQGETSFETMYLQMTATAKRLDEFAKSAQSKKLAGVVCRCLEKKPGARPQTVREIAEELKEISSSGLNNIDLFSNRTLAFRRNGMMAMAAVSAFAIAALVILLMLSWIHNENTASLNSLIKTDQDKVSRKIMKLRAAVSACKNPSTIKDSALQERYFNNLLSLGREQMLSASSTDNTDADKTFSDVLNFCECIGGEFCRNHKAICYGLHAVSRMKRGDFSGSELDYCAALKLVSAQHGDKDLEVDILMERSILRILTHRFSEALHDLVVSNAIYDSVPYSLGSMDKLMQKLDKQGCNRSDLLEQIASTLRTVQAKSSDEAVQMVILSNQLAKRMSNCRLRTKSEVMSALKFSLSLLRGIKGNEELKVETKKLLAAVK